MAATFLFVGLDANYDAAIERSPIFQSLLEYHQDGVTFWRHSEVHHPFLLPQYTGVGRRYHRNFAKIGFSPKHASLVSFVELLHVPTVGRSKLSAGDLDRLHLERVNSAIIDGSAQHIFISAGVVRLMRSSNGFPWLSREPSRSQILPVLYKHGNRSVYLHLHFSNYGKFQQQMDAEAKAIALLIPPAG